MQVIADNVNKKIINEICGHSVGDVWYRQSGNSVEMDSPDCFYVEDIWSIDPKYGNVLQMNKYANESEKGCTNQRHKLLGGKRAVFTGLGNHMPRSKHSERYALW